MLDIDLYFRGRYIRHYVQLFLPVLAVTLQWGRRLWYSEFSVFQTFIMLVLFLTNGIIDFDLEFSVQINRWSLDNYINVIYLRYNLFRHLKCFVVVFMLNKLFINLIWYPISCPYWFKVSWLTLFAKEIHAIRRGCVHAIFVYPAYTCKYY